MDTVETLKAELNTSSKQSGHKAVSGKDFEISKIKTRVLFANTITIH